MYFVAIIYFANPWTHHCLQQLFGNIHSSSHFWWWFVVRCRRPVSGGITFSLQLNNYHCFDTSIAELKYKNSIICRTTFHKVCKNNQTRLWLRLEWSLQVVIYAAKNSTIVSTYTLFSNCWCKLRSNMLALSVTITAESKASSVIAHFSSNIMNNHSSKEVTLIGRVFGRYINCWPVMLVINENKTFFQMEIPCRFQSQIPSFLLTNFLWTSKSFARWTKEAASGRHSTTKKYLIKCSLRSAIDRSNFNSINHQLRLTAIVNTSIHTIHCSKRCIN